MPLIDREHDSNELLLDGKQSGDVVLINKRLAELEDDAEFASFPKLKELENNAEYTSLPKLTELVKKHFNLTRTEKEKSHRPISHFLACIIKPIRRPCFLFAESLAGLTDGLVMSGAKLKRREVVVGFSR